MGGTKRKQRNNLNIAGKKGSTSRGIFTLEKSDVRVKSEGRGSTFTGGRGVQENPGTVGLDSHNSGEIKFERVGKTEGVNNSENTVTVKVPSCEACAGIENKTVLSVQKALLESKINALDVVDRLERHGGDLKKDGALRRKTFNENVEETNKGNSASSIKEEEEDSEVDGTEDDGFKEDGSKDNGSEEESSEDNGSGDNSSEDSSSRKEIQCEICKHVFTSTCTLRNHLRTFHPEISYPCNFCNQIFKVPQARDGHEKRRHLTTKEPSFRCKWCSKIVKSQSALTGHEASHTGQRFHGCRYCSKEFVSSNSRDIHEQRKHADAAKPGKYTEKAFKCSWCPEMFYSEEYQLLHESVHTGNRPFPCRFCPANSSSKSEIKLHEFQHHREKLDPGEYPAKQKCPHCAKTFLRKNGLRLHLRTHTGERRFACELCSTRFHDSRGVRIHKMRRHPEVFGVDKEDLKTFKCLTCDKSFMTKHDVSNHCKFLHNEERNYKCSPCGRSFKTKHSLYLHELRCIASKKEMYAKHECTWCGKKFLNTSELKSHVRVHTGDRPFKCQQCNKGFARLDWVAKHVAVVHASLEEKEALKLFTCSFCDKKFMQRAHLESHAKTHKAEKEFGCQFCDKRFKSDAGARSHEIRIHDADPVKKEAIKRYACSICPKKFEMKVNFETHERTHTGEMPFKCSICSKLFRSSRALKSHTGMRHSDERNFVCQVCKAAFPMEVALKAHQRAHTTVGNPFKCDLCKRAYKYAHNLSQHKRLKHGSKTLN